MYEPIGYWTNCDDAYCTNCFDGEKYADGAPWEGFEDWSQAEAIFGYGSESDSPTHCHRCEALIEHGLTQDGYRYVTDAIFGALRDDWPYKPETDPRRLCVLKAWWQAYSDGIVEGISLRIQQWPNCDEFSPRKDEYNV